MTKRTEAYVDTSALIAFADRSDTHHDRFRRAFADPPRLVTTVLVVAEGHGWFLKRFDLFRALHFIAMIESMTPLRILQAGRSEQTAAIQYLRRFSDQALTLTDALGLHVMKTRKIPICWSTDRHLGLTGVPLLIHEKDQ